MIFYSLLLLVTLAASTGLYLFISNALKRAAAEADRRTRERAVSIIQADDELAGGLCADVIGTVTPLLELVRRWQAARGLLVATAMPGRMAHAWRRAEVPAIVERDERERLEDRCSKLRLRWALIQGALLLAATSVVIIFAVVKN